MNANKNQINKEVIANCLILIAYCHDLYSKSKEPDMMRRRYLLHRDYDEGLDRKYKLAQQHAARTERGRCWNFVRDRSRRDVVCRRGTS